VADKIVSRARVKDLIGIPRADTLWDERINDVIQQATSEVQEIILDRALKYEQRVEYLQSYEQMPADPSPQYLWMRAWPIDTEEDLDIVYSPNDQHATNGLTLTVDTDYTVVADKGLIIIKGAVFLTPDLWVGTRGIGYSPRGFQVTYYGGYQVNSEYEEQDPLDDFNVLEVPSGLASIVASKIADDWLAKKVLLPWTDEQRRTLNTYRRKNTI